MERLELNNEKLNKDLIFKLREAGRYLHPRPADKNRQKEILVFLSENGTIPQRELTRKLKIKPPSVSELLRKLEYADLVRRVPNEHDRRNMNVQLTDLGYAVAKEYKKNSKDQEEELFTVLTPEEKDELLMLLDKLLGYWEEILEPEPPRPGHRPHHLGPDEPPRPPHEGPGEPPRPPHERPDEPPRPPRGIGSFPFGPFGKFRPEPHRPPEFHPEPESMGKEPEGPETWDNFFEVMSSIIENISGRKGPFTPPDYEDFLEPDEPPIPPEEPSYEPDEDSPIPPEDSDVQQESDIDVTEEDELE